MSGRLDVLRGEAGVLVDTTGQRFAEPYTTPVLAELQQLGVPWYTEDRGLQRYAGPSRAYDGQDVPAPPPGNPPATAHQVSWVGGATGFWDVAANWLDTTTNTSHVPTATDIVTIAPGVTVTVRSGNQAAGSVQVAAGAPW